MPPAERPRGRPRRWDPASRDPAGKFGPGSGLGGGQSGVGDVEQRLVEHHLVVAGMLDGKPHVGQGRVGEVAPRVDQRLGQQPKSLVASAVNSPRRSVKWCAGAACDTPALRANSRSETPFGAALGDQARGLGEDHRAQVAVVVVRPVHEASIASQT